ncbi:unnamed protein product [Peronospora belbahrii]|uniref:RNase H type-1 domain-containing protein n=1 Tax=Peronospora belbahrii TaxID=622444 RepID=A0ABN8CR93_9STRA|nr:unnamed protein product [Peronospora belbahrii]
MEDSTLPNEARTSPPRSHLRNALTRFRGSTYQPGDEEEGRNLAHVHLPTHTTCVMWVASVGYGHASSTNNIAEYRGLVHGLRQAKSSGYSPLRAIGDSALVLSQLKTDRSPRKTHLALICREVRALADDITIAI